jgi:hypothetical protein
MRRLLRMSRDTLGLRKNGSVSVRDGRHFPLYAATDVTNPKQNPQ